MTVLAAQDIEWEVSHGRLSIEPFHPDKQVVHGMSFGLSAAGYDVRINLAGIGLGGVILEPGGFMLAVTSEYVSIPNDIIVFVHDKSTLARKGIALQNTVLEPGWKGFTTLEITNHSKEDVTLYHNQPIAQFIFHRLSSPTNKPYAGKYQDQPAKPIAAIMEESDPGLSEGKSGRL